jgi:DMSO/TMAO reductase YedYZ molybdopterin-dependent catalytic subunit
MMHSTHNLEAQPGSTPDERARRDQWRGLLAGALATIGMLVAMVLLRQLSDVMSLLDAMADALLLALPMSMFSLSLDLFGAQAKTLMLVGLMVLLVVIGALIGRTYARQTAGARRPMWLRAFAIGAVVFAVSMAFMAWFAPNRDPGAFTSSRSLPLVFQLAAEAVVFSVFLAVSLSVLRRQDPAPGGAEGVDEPSRLSRRRLATRATMLGVAAGGVGVLGAAVARVANRPTVGVTPAGEISPAITPNDDFYVISKNFVDPDPDRGDNWYVTIDGVVRNELKLTRTDLEAMAAPAFVSTLTCISNPVGGPLIGTAEWVGAPLADVLRKAGVGEGAVKVIFEAEDDYTDSIPLERAMAPEPMLVWQMNGVPLPRFHGTPVRLIVPGIYGMKNVKWLTKITVSNEDYQGFWQQRGWSDPAIVKTASRFDVPGDRDLLAIGRTTIGGVAFGGDRGISAVEVSFDGGDTWQEATIRENPSPGGLSWVIWDLMWDAKQGSYDLVVRATDGTGEVQTDEHAPELPDGSSGWHRIQVGVV